MGAGTSRKQKIKVKEYVTDKAGHKVAAVIDIKELSRLEGLLEDLYDLKVMDDRIAEPEEEYEAYSKKRRTSFRV